MKVVTSEQMKRIEERATAAFGIPSVVLMENAARAATDVILRKFATAERIAIFCGPGMNGGDGYAIARHLHNRGRVVFIVALGTDRLAGDALLNRSIAAALELPIFDADDEEKLDEALVHTLESDLIVDAIFGTGLSRPAAGIYAAAIDAIASLRIPVVAIDVPSGLQASSTEVSRPVIVADCTITFALPKIAHVFEPSASFCGELFVEDISIPHLAVDRENVATELLGRDVLWPLFPLRATESHKGTHGHLAVMAGSAGRSGAAILTTRGALRNGVGLVTVLTDAETARLIDTVSIESMSRAVSTVDEIIDACRNMDAAVIGPGLADDDAAYQRARKIIEGLSIPMIVDASALNAFAGRAAELRGVSRVLTPHPGELARLAGGDAASVNADRIAAVSRAARDTGCVVLLKGHRTLIAAPDGRIAINTTGNPLLATGGMGDVLSGVIGALLARKVEAFEAACAGAYLHGLAADLLAASRGDTGLLATELADNIPAAIAKVRQA